MFDSKKELYEKTIMEANEKIFKLTRELTDSNKLNRKQAENI